MGVQLLVECNDAAASEVERIADARDRFESRYGNSVEYAQFKSSTYGWPTIRTPITMELERIVSSVLGCVAYGHDTPTERGKSRYEFLGQVAAVNGIYIMPPGNMPNLRTQVVFLWSGKEEVFDLGAARGEVRCVPWARKDSNAYLSGSLSQWEVTVYQGDCRHGEYDIYWQSLATVDGILFGPGSLYRPPPHVTAISASGRPCTAKPFICDQYNRKFDLAQSELSSRFPKQNGVLQIAEGYSNEGESMSLRRGFAQHTNLSSDGHPIYIRRSGRLFGP